MSQGVENAVVANPFYREYSRSFFGFIRAVARYFLISDKNKILASDKKTACIYVASGDNITKVKGNLDPNDDSSSRILIESSLTEVTDDESEGDDDDESPTRNIHWEISLRS
jgi:hypothetical protein